MIREEIIQEGWEEKSPNFYTKREFRFGVLPDGRTIIRKGSWYTDDTIFEAKLKDIETFKLICKILEI